MKMGARRKKNGFNYFLIKKSNDCMYADCICVAEDGVFACAEVFPTASGHSRCS